jgi:hypothetical protein
MLITSIARGLPHMSRTLLAERLRRLEKTGVLERRGASRGKPTEYRLTAAGRELQRIIDLFAEWGARWAFGPPRPSELDPIILLWWMRGGSPWIAFRAAAWSFSSTFATHRSGATGADRSRRCLGLPEAPRLRRGCDCNRRHHDVLPSLARSPVLGGSHPKAKSA